MKFFLYYIYIFAKDAIKLQNYKFNYTAVKAIGIG